jgi:hypothetical protein
VISWIHVHFNLDYKGLAEVKLHTLEGFPTLFLMTGADNECYFCPSAPYRLFCPRSWKQMNAFASPTGSSEEAGATFITNPSSVVAAHLLSWDNGHVSVMVLA